MRLHSLDRSDLPAALPLLTRGFPTTPKPLWERALQRIAEHAGASGPAAHILQRKGEDVGVIVTLESSRPGADGTPRRVVNLSSWYVDDSHRWLAPRMLRDVTASEDTLFTDLTPTPSVRQMIGRFGFQPWKQGSIVYFLPWSAMRSGTAEVVPLERVPPGTLSEDTRVMLEQHAGWDCISAVLWDGQRASPLVFSRMRRAGMPVARLIYAENKPLVLRHMASISRFLIGQKRMLLVMNGNRDGKTPGGIFLARSPSYFKGPMDPSCVDYAYSEYVFLQI